jgi:Holliday junction DNA helicase RuvA
MIWHLRGKLAHKAPTYAVIEVGGVGYGLAISLITYDRLPQEQEEVRLFTYQYVREDRLELFGFAEEEEREVFELLIGVSGIGPHSALTILSGMSLRGLQEAIANGRVNELMSIKGVGRKTAERMVLDLRDKIRLRALPAGEGEKAGKESGMAQEAVLALLALGFAGPAARQAVQRALEKSGTGQSVQQLIRQALKER